MCDGRKWCTSRVHATGKLVAVDTFIAGTVKGRRQGFIERFHRALLEEHLRIKGPTYLVRGRRGDAEGLGRPS